MTSRSRIPVYTLYNNHDHSPLALGMIGAYAQTFDGGRLRGALEFVPEMASTPDTARRLVDAHGPGVFLGSNYLWSADNNLAVAKVVKSVSPASIVVLGGPSVPKYDYACEEYLAAHPWVDVAVRGEGEETAAELLATLAAQTDPFTGDRGTWATVAGITFRDAGATSATGVTRTADRDRESAIDRFPSPYLGGYFEDTDTSRWLAAIVETNRGCPYGCTFCDWGSATLSKIRQFSLERVQGEIDWIARRGISVLWIADANFGIFPRDLAIAEMIAECKRRHGYPRQVIVNYTKNATERLAAIIQTLYAADVAANPIISIQTHDPQTLENIARSNIRTDRYEQLIDVFRAERLPVTSDLMIGLPGSTVQSFKADLQFFFDRKVYAKAYPTQVLPNSPMAHRDYMAKFNIKVDNRGYIISTSSFTRLDRWTMGSLYGFYQLFVGYSVLKYFLYVLQVDYGVKALDLIEDVQTDYNEDPGRLIETSRLADAMTTRDAAGRPWTAVMHARTAADWDPFHEEILAFCTRRYGVGRDSALGAALQAQTAVMPMQHRTMPAVFELEHDVEAYFSALARMTRVTDAGANWRRLADYGAGEVHVEDPHRLCEGLDERLTYDNHSIVWELRSGISLAPSNVHHLIQVRPAQVAST